MNLQEIKAQLVEKKEVTNMQELDSSLIDAVSGGKGDWWVSATWNMRF